MTHVIANLIKEKLTATVGLLDFTLPDVAEDRSFTFSSKMANGNTCKYAAAHETANEAEIGIGTYNAGVLERTQVISSTNANAKVNFSAGNVDVRLIAEAGDIGFIDQAFSPNIDLSANRNYNQQPVFEPINFVAVGVPIQGNIVTCSLVADGVVENIPTFDPEFLESTGSSGYDNTNNVKNIIQFTYLYGKYYYSIMQAVGDTGATDSTAPVLTSATVFNATPTYVDLAFNEALDTSAALLTASFSVAGASAHNVTAVAFNGTDAIRLTLDAGLAISEVATVTYTQPVSAANRVKDASANYTDSIVNNSITNLVGVEDPAIIFTAKGSLVTQSVSGTGYNYTVASPTDNGNAWAGSPSKKLPSGATGYIEMGFDGSVDEATLSDQSPVLMAQKVYAFIGNLFGANANCAAAVMWGYDGNWRIGDATGPWGAANIVPGRPCVLGDRARIRRAAAGALYADISSDGGVTWTTIHAFATAETGDLFASASMGQGVSTGPTFTYLTPRISINGVAAP